MSWWEQKERRTANRQKKGRSYDEARARRRHGWAVLLEKKTGEVVAQAHKGCFGRMLALDPDVYRQWALGTKGEIHSS